MKDYLILLLYTKYCYSSGSRSGFYTILNGVQEWFKGRQLMYIQYVGKNDLEKNVSV